MCKIKKMENTSKGKFVHLRVHSDNSILNGVSKVQKLIAKATELEMDALALTDICAMYGSYSFWKGCNEVGIKPILGSQFHLAPRKMSDKEFKIDNKTSDIVLLAKNLVGYKNLIKLVSISHLEGFYYKPRIDKEQLSKYREGLICITGNAFSIIGRALQLGEAEKVHENIKFFKDIYQDDFYFDLQKTGVESQEFINKKLIELSTKYKIECVATNDVYYASKDLAKVRDVLWAIDDGRKLSDPSRRKTESEENYLKSYEEMSELFSDYQQAISNTVLLAEKIENYDIGYGRIQPEFPGLPEGETEESYLKKLVYESAEKRFGYFDEKLDERLKLELGIIHEKGYDGYFLVMYDIVNYARDNDILVSTRGSAAGSAVSYALSITTVDPIKWGLFFERFLNPERKSFPDIDLDISDKGRDQLLEWVHHRYGEESVCHVGALGKLTTKAAIRDVGRVLDIDLKKIDRLSKLVPVKFGKVLNIDACLSDENAGKSLNIVEENRRDITEFREIIASDKVFKKLVKYVKAIEGCIRHISTHACGLLITSPAKVNDYCPLQRESKHRKRIITQLEGKYLEDVGFMKFDLLGLANLSIIADTLKFIKKNRNENIDIYRIPEDDKKTFSLLQEGDTTAVFQLEGAGMRKYLKQLKPNSLEEISAMCALYRPGPIQFIPSYIQRKFGKEKVDYAVPELEEIMKITYGLPVYQEQILQIASRVAGYSLGEADVLRRAIGKKIPEVMEAEAKKFKEGVKNHTKYGDKEADLLWSYALPFADYGFNKAHSAAYALVAYQTAYLKANYTTEFYAALMLSDINNLEKLTRDILDAEKHGIKLIKPDINRSNVSFDIEKEGVILFGLGGMKGVGISSVSWIVEERQKNGKFKSFTNFIERLDSSKVSKGVIESLIKVGALDSFGHNRSTLLSIFEDQYVRSLKLKLKKKEGLVDIFGFSADSVTNEISVEEKISEIDEVSSELKIEWEKEILGVPITKSDLSRIKKYMKFKGYDHVSEAKDYEDGDYRKLYGKVSNYRTIVTKKGDEMAFFNLEDLHFSIPMTIFPKTLDSLKEKVTDKDNILVSGYYQKDNNREGLIVKSVKKIELSQALKAYNRWKKKGMSNILQKKSIKNLPIGKIKEIKLKQNFDIDRFSEFISDINDFKLQESSQKRFVQISILVKTNKTGFKQINSKGKYSPEVISVLEKYNDIIEF